MNRAVEIVNSLRAGMVTMLKQDSSQRVSTLRMFNFEKNRVSLRMELIDAEMASRPIGMIDVTEFPTGAKSQSSCNCFMTDLATGKSEKLLLKLNTPEQKKSECAKVFNFFRKVLNLPVINEKLDASVDTATPASQVQDIAEQDDVRLYPPSDGMMPEQPRGAQ
jgi:hypothetical protein